ncbi:MAG: RsmD family RNA methyltransferase [Bacteroidaceae bacterium]|nr:RsmD family RNA methyltransferase [Bacteroidaceae bacterium]
MRIISGKYKGRHFDVPRNFKARPTTDFAKENLFNILANNVDFEETIALDLFSGTGSISLELLSRGCKEVTSVEMDSLHFVHLKRCSGVLGDKNWRMVRDDVFRFIRRCSASYDLIFADPPYALKDLKEIPDLILQKEMLNKDGILIFEHGKDYDFSEHPCFFRHIAYGSVNFSFFKKKE